GRGSSSRRAPLSERVHFIGICGTAMATVAAMPKRKGLDVRGSDQDGYPPMSDFLEAEGIPTLAGYHPEHITGDLDVVIVGNAISLGNPELEEVLDRKIRYCSLPEAIREHFLWGARSIVIAGTHGKTTTTSLTGWLLTHGGVDPTVLVGGIARNFGDQGSSYRIGQGRDFVIEGDEYDSAFFDKTAKFLKYLPDIAVVNNVEFDHADIYENFEAVTLAFRRLVNLVPRRGLLLRGADSPGVAGGVTVYDDFAHHPTAVAETLAGLRASNPDARIWAVFEPRSASSCRRIFQDDFARAFAGATEVLIAPIFRSKLPEAERLSI